MADRTITELLTDYDIRHEATEGRRRHIYWQGRSFGMMDAQEACVLLELLTSAKGGKK